MTFMLKKLLILSALLSTLFSPAASSQDQVAPGVWLSRNGNFRLSTTDIESSTPNEWTLYVRTSKRAPVADAIIEVHAYHPATNKILPRIPIISAHMGRGQYDVYNLYFDESGQWDINVVVSSGSTVDAILLPVQIP